MGRVRIVAIVALLPLAPVLTALLMALHAGPAAAHSCAAPVRTEVGATTSLTIGVAAELQPVVAIDVEVPEGFELTGSTEVRSWQVAAEEDVVHFTSGRIAPFGCGYVTVRGRAERKGRLLFPVTVTTEDGTKKRYAETDPTLPTAGGLLYVGIDPPGARDGASEDGDSGGGGAGAAWAVAAAGGALAVAAAVAVWRWRRPPARTNGSRAGRAPARRPTGSSRPGTRNRRKPRRR